MGVQPPQDDTSDGPDAVDFGIAALDGHLDRAELSFPADADEIVRALGDPEVDLNASGRSVRLSLVVDRVDEHRFRSRRELLEALHPEFEQLRRQTGGGFLARLKGLLPGQ